METFEEFITRCARCNRYRNGDVWLAPEQAPADRLVTHGLCPDCFAQVMERPIPPRLLLALEEDL